LATAAPARRRSPARKPRTAPKASLAPAVAEEPPPEPSRKLSVLAILHGYPGPGGHNAGAERTAEAVLRWLAARGHRCRVLTYRGSPTAGSVEVLIGTSRRDEIEFARSADVLVTHLDRTHEVLFLGRRLRKPVISLVHNDRQLAATGVWGRDGLVVFNSEWIARAVGWSGPSVVLRPIVDPAAYEVAAENKRRRLALTLFNLMESKGAPLFYALARRMPERYFLGVRGSYGAQIVPSPLPAAVEILENLDDVRPVYERTRVLLMPSAYESFGRVAVEAGASGIPTIAHPTPGLREALGPAGIFVDRSDPEAWVATIRVLDDEKAYAAASRLARARAVDLWEASRPELLAFERAMIGVAR